MSTVKEWEHKKAALKLLDKVEGELSDGLHEAVLVSFAHKRQINYDKVYQEYLDASPEVQELLEYLGMVIRC